MSISTSTNPFVLVSKTAGGLREASGRHRGGPQGLGGRGGALRPGRHHR